jgi:hypothetical protein
MFILKRKLNFLIFTSALSLLAGGAEPDIPYLIRIFDNAIINTYPSYICTLSVRSDDPESDDIYYEIQWDFDPDFLSTLCDTIGPYASGDTAITTIPASAETLYYWRARATDDPLIVSNWSEWSEARSFTMDMEAGDVYWYQVSGNQFTKCIKKNISVQGDSIIINKSVDTTTILVENWDDGDYSGWHFPDYNSDGVTWTVGTTDDLILDFFGYIIDYQPPNFGTNYAYYSDDDAGSDSPETHEQLYYDPIFIDRDIDSLKIYYEYGFRKKFFGNEVFSFYIRFYYPSGDTWGPDFVYRTYNSSVRNGGSELIDLSDSLYPSITGHERPDSFQVSWIYSDSVDQGWAAAIDSVRSFTILTKGVLVTPPITFNDLKTENPDRNHWDGVKWTKSSADDSIGVQIEYLNGGIWNLVPDLDLPGNSDGFFNQSSDFCAVDLSTLNTSTYETLRIKVIFRKYSTKSASNPSLKMLALGNTQDNVTGIPENEKTFVFGISRINPNPFTNYTKIQYQIFIRANVVFQVFDITGREVITVENGIKEPGNYIFNWRGTDKNGNLLSSGVYFLKTKAGNYEETSKIILVR